LLGENGAGKTTLMKVLAGIIKPESGRIQINGKEVQILSPIHSQQLGIGMVHQHFMLIPTLSVAKNVCIGLKSQIPFPNILKLKMTYKNFEKYNLQIDQKQLSPPIQSDSTLRNSESVISRCKNTYPG
jgi:simple sugar transport system ATP-binding protein